ncbi:nodulation protein NfeD [Candidatus Uabimicrobium sp. HlEnr_7]|uniref:NfeD family protein n=1 Tax=Candidatus Uabimicrobium helgolandensis TaxID=3095367 RepID=UPI0035573815
MKNLFLVLLLTVLVFAQNDAHTVYNLKVEEPLSNNLTKVIINKLKAVDKEHAKVIILEINSSGGKVEAANSICRELDFLAENGVPTYAYVTQAQGASALLAVACEKIYMQPGATLGNVVLKTTFGSIDKEAIKVAKEYFGECAKLHMYPVALMQAMVDPSMEVRQISYRAQPLFKTTEELNEMRSDPSKPNKEIHDKGVIVKRGAVAIFTATECKKYGICREVYETKTKLLAALNLTEYNVEKVSNVSSDTLTQILTHKWMRILFLTLGFLGILIEFLSPGIGVPILGGMAFLFLFFIGGTYAGLVESWEIVLFVLGLGFIGLEVFAMPGMIVIGVAGAVMCFCGVLFSMQSFVYPSTEREMSLFMGNVMAITMSIGANIGMFFSISNLFPKKKPLGPLSLETGQISKAHNENLAKNQELVGKTGKVIATLRPSGRVEIDEEFYDVVTQGGMISAGETVSVLFVEGNRIIVEKTEAVSEASENTEEKAENTEKTEES